MKGQTSLEFLVVLASLLAFLYFWVSLSLSSTSQISDSLKFRDAVLAGKQLSSAVNSLCLLSPGSSVELRLWFPTGTEIKMRNTPSHDVMTIKYKNESVEFNLTCRAITVGSPSGASTYRLTRWRDGVEIQIVP